MTESSEEEGCNTLPLETQQVKLNTFGSAWTRASHQRSFRNALASSSSSWNDHADFERRCCSVEDPKSHSVSSKVRWTVESMDELLTQCVTMLDDAPGYFKSHKSLRNLREAVVQARSELIIADTFGRRFENLRDQSDVTTHRFPKPKPFARHSHRLSSGDEHSSRPASTEGSNSSNTSLNYSTISNATGFPQDGGYSSDEPQARTVTIGIQTEVRETCDTEVQTVSKPPLLPPMLPGRSPSKQSVSSAHSESASIDDGETYASAYRPTPMLTCMFTVSEAMKHWNVARRGSCCPYHAGLKHTLSACRRLAAKECQPLFSCFCGWQCSVCLAVNDGDATCCDICSDQPDVLPTNRGH